MAGEIGADFPAWGSPVNTRDPALGLDGKSGHFGRSDGNGAMFLMADGSVRSFSANVDPRILKVLSTPDGNEVAPPPYYDEKSFLIPTITNEDRFRFTYEIPIDEQFGVVTAPSFRDDVLTELFRRPDVEVSLQDFNSSRSKAHQILMFSEAAMRAAGEREKNKRSLWSTGNSKTEVTQMACLFAQTRADDRTSGELFTLIKTAETLGVRDLLSCFDRVLFVMNTVDGIPPDFGFNGDLVVKSYPIRRYRRQSDSIEGQLDAIVLSLQEYCLDGPEHLRDLRFNVLKDQEVWVPKDESLVVGLDVQDQPEPQSPDQVKSHQALCATLGVSTDLSECLIPFAEIISLDTLSLQPSKADQKRDPQMAAQQFKQIRDEFSANVLAKAGKIVKFQIEKVTVVECTRISEQQLDPVQ